jgi:hypothetical protein
MEYLSQHIEVSLKSVEVVVLFPVNIEKKVRTQEEGESHDRYGMRFYRVISCGSRFPHADDIDRKSTDSELSERLTSKYCNECPAHVCARDLFAIIMIKLVIISQQLILSAFRADSKLNIALHMSSSCKSSLRYVFCELHFGSEFMDLVKSGRQEFDLFHCVKILIPESFYT